MLPIPEITDVELAFPARALEWMPPMEAIPPEFHDMNGQTEWNRIARAWFYTGLPSTTGFHVKEGVDGAAALRAISATLGSFAPKHEHKEAAVAYMLASWFDKITGWESG